MNYGILQSRILEWVAFPFSWDIPKKGNARECSNYHTIALVSHASKVMLKIFKARFQQFVNRELPDVQAEFRKVRGADIKCQHLLNHRKNKRIQEKHLLLP